MTAKNVKGIAELGRLTELTVRTADPVAEPVLAEILVVPTRALVASPVELT